jgi:hypothetical protein
LLMIAATASGRSPMWHETPEFGTKRPTSISASCPRHPNGLRSDKPGSNVEGQSRRYAPSRGVRNCA